LLGVIGPSEAQIFILYHGFGIDRKYTFIEIGDSLDLKACNVRETYTHAMKRVRRYVRRTTVESGTSNVLAYLKEKLPVEYPTAMIDG
jgi:DNA-directed RNA polymerase sigma subunit (sigma70/sigma32)